MIVAQAEWHNYWYRYLWATSNFSVVHHWDMKWAGNGPYPAIILITKIYTE